MYTGPRTPWLAFYGANQGYTYWEESRRQPRGFKALDAVDISAVAALWTPATGKKFVFMGALLSVSGTPGNVVLKDGANTVYLLPSTSANTPLSIDLRNGILSAAANNILTAVGSADAIISGTIWGTEE